MKGKSFCFGKALSRTMVHPAINSRRPSPTRKPAEDFVSSVHLTYAKAIGVSSATGRRFRLLTEGLQIGPFRPSTRQPFILSSSKENGWLLRTNGRVLHFAKVQSSQRIGTFWP